MSSSLPDEEARRSIRLDLDRSLFVEAGAGTGKTAELVRRIIAIVATGRARIDQVVAITFTEAAAGELRERVRQALEVKVLQATASEAASCRAALTSLDEAPIQTIHAFAKRLLMRHPGDVGLPPVFEVNDQIVARLAFDRRWRRFVGDTFGSSVQLSSELEALLRTSLALGLELRHIRQLAMLLEQSWHRIDRPEGFLRRAPVCHLDGLVGHIQRAVVNRDVCADPSNKIYLALGDLMQWVRQLEEAQASQSPLRVIEALRAMPGLKVRNAKRKGVWPDAVCVEMFEAFDNIEDEVEALLGPLRQYAVDGLVGLCSRFVLDGVQGRVSSGVLDFHDLLVFARNLLRDNVDVRHQLQAAYKFVLVDEFQDTDPLQAEIVKLLSDGHSLFVVGDPKQSIYRFRNADPAQYQAVRDVMEGAVVGLTSNFRTLSPVVQWINTVFETILLPSMGRGWQTLDAGRLDNGVPASVHLLGGALPKDQYNSAAVRAQEVSEVVAVLSEALTQRWAVGDNDERRPIRYGDMAVLMPTRTALPALERTFKDAGIPYRIESRSLIWSTQEIRDLLSVLRSIDNPHDEVATVAALRSPALACSDRELVEWKAAGGTWDYRSGAGSPPGGPVAVAEALARLDDLHSKRQWVTVPDLVLSVIDTLGLMELAHALPRQREPWSRLRFFLDRARSWFEDGGAALHDFVLWCRTQADEGADALESVLPDADDDAVRVMTIHASKGLEFPLVALIGLGSLPRRQEAASVLWTADGSRHVSLGRSALGCHTPGYPPAKDDEERLDQEEQLRLLYVGATRARDHLVVSVNHVAPKTKGKASSLAAHLLEAASTVEHPERAEVDWPAEAELVAVVPAQRRGGLDRSTVIAAGAVPAARSATAIAKLLNGDDTHLPRSSAPTGDAAMDDLAERLAFGRAVHAGLEMMGPGQEADLPAIAAAVAADEDLAGRVDEVEHSLRLAVASRPWQEAASSGRWWREVAVCNVVGATVVEGYVDLVYERDDGLVVIDYKTDFAESSAEAGALVDRYRWQLLTYAYALQQTLGKPVVEASLLLISPLADIAQIVDVGDPQVGQKELHEALIAAKA